MSQLLTYCSKMPGASWSLPPVLSCPTGSKLAKEPGSVCSKCYAKRGWYQSGNVKGSQLWRLGLIEHPAFVAIMVGAILKEAIEGRDYFRWHDSGDIAGDTPLKQMGYFLRICDICDATPGVYHRLPTREVGVITQYLTLLPLPRNLCVQISGNYIDKKPEIVPSGCQASMVYTVEPPEDVFVCPATTERKVCGDCRACWNLQEASLIAYHLH